MRRTSAHRRRDAVSRTKRVLAAPAAETRDRIMKAAIRLFSDHGFAKVSVRDICRTADVNIAAVNYHFRDKMGLYLAVVHVAIDAMRDTSDLTMQASPGSSPADRLRHYIRTYVTRLMTLEGPASWIHRLMRHETGDPTPAAVEIFDRAIRPRVAYLAELVAELIGCPTTDPRVWRTVASIQAQCLFYRPDPFRAAVIKDWPTKADTPDRIAAHILDFSLAGIRAVA
jgi:AcrR family transcriptional regulator